LLQPEAISREAQSVSEDNAVDSFIGRKNPFSALDADISTQKDGLS
jgi:hypothetical protein